MAERYLRCVGSSRVSWKEVVDWQLMATIRAQDYTFVTNNRSDFLALHGQEPLHAGVIIIVPSVTPARQRELFTAALRHIGARTWTAGQQIQCLEYALPQTSKRDRDEGGAVGLRTPTLYDKELALGQGRTSERLEHASVLPVTRESRRTFYWPVAGQ